jgi:Na+/H+ antiporter NhaD/arsenite permease-like protein
MKWIILAITVVMYVLIIAFPKRKSWAAMGTAALMLILRAITPLEALEFINVTVLMIFIGALLLADLFIYSRVPAMIADTIVMKSPNSGFAILAILVMTAIISAFVENVATVLVMAPIALALCEKLKISPRMFIVGLAVMANLEGTATLVGDPPSMIFAGFSGYGFNDFFFYNGRPSIFFAVQIGMITGALFFYYIFAKTGKNNLQIEKTIIISEVPATLLIIKIVGLALFSFIFNGLTIASGILVVALAVVGFFWYWLGRKEGIAKSWKMVKELDWDTVFFLVGIFLVIGAIETSGLLEDFAGVLLRLIGSNVLLGFVLIIGVSVIISGFVDNVPYIIAMLPVASTVSNQLGLKPELYMFALLIGSCLGGNLTPYGASANVVSMGILRKHNDPINFSQWLKIALPFTVLTVAAATAFVWFVWR